VTAQNLYNNIAKSFLVSQSLGLWFFTYLVYL
jgi:hypothetical protein